MPVPARDERDGAVVLVERREVAIGAVVRRGEARVVRREKLDELGHGAGQQNVVVLEKKHETLLGTGTVTGTGTGERRIPRAVEERTHHAIV